MRECPDCHGDGKDHGLQEPERSMNPCPNPVHDREARTENCTCAYFGSGVRRWRRGIEPDCPVHGRCPTCGSADPAKRGRVGDYGGSAVPEARCSDPFHKLEKQPPKTKESDARCPHPDQPTPSTQDTGTPTRSDDVGKRSDAELADRRSGSKAKPYRLPFLPR